MMIFLHSCAPEVFVVKKSMREPLTSDQEVHVFWMDDPYRDTIDMIGYIYIGDKGNTAEENCTFEEVLRIATYEARFLGGNVLQIQKHVLPISGQSKCHQIEAKVYYQNPVKQLPNALPVFNIEKPKSTYIEGLGISLSTGIAQMPQAKATYIDPALMGAVYQDLRLGITHTAAMNFFIYRGLGFGFRYNNYSTASVAFVKDSITRPGFDTRRINGQVGIHTITPTIAYAFNLFKGNLLVIPQTGIGYGRIQYDIRSESTRIRAISETTAIHFQVETAIRLKGSFYVSAILGHDRMGVREMTIDDFVNRLNRRQLQNPDWHSRNFAQVGLRYQF
jgi:hypothetical protein